MYPEDTKNSYKSVRKGETTQFSKNGQKICADTKKKEMDGKAHEKILSFSHLGKCKLKS